MAGGRFRNTARRQVLAAVVDHQPVARRARRASSLHLVVVAGELRRRSSAATVGARRTRVDCRRRRPSSSCRGAARDRRGCPSTIDAPSSSNCASSAAAGRRPCARGHHCWTSRAAPAPDRLRARGRRRSRSRRSRRAGSISRAAERKHVEVGARRPHPARSRTRSARVWNGLKRSSRTCAHEHGGARCVEQRDQRGHPRVFRLGSSSGKAGQDVPGARRSPSSSHQRSSWMFWKPVQPLSMSLQHLVAEALDARLDLVARRRGASSAAGRSAGWPSPRRTARARARSRASLGNSVSM